MGCVARSSKQVENRCAMECHIYMFKGTNDSYEFFGRVCSLFFEWGSIFCQTKPRLSHACSLKVITSHLMGNVRPNDFSWDTERICSKLYAEFLTAVYTVVCCRELFVYTVHACCEHCRPSFFQPVEERSVRIIREGGLFPRVSVL